MRTRTPITIPAMAPEERPLEPPLLLSGMHCVDCELHCVPDGQQCTLSGHATGTDSSHLPVPSPTNEFEMEALPSDAIEELVETRRSDAIMKKRMVPDHLRFKGTRDGQKNVRSRPKRSASATRPSWGAIVKITSENESAGACGGSGGCWL